MRRFLLLARRLEVADEGGRGELHHLLARRASHREIGGDEADPFPAPKLGCDTKTIDNALQRVKRKVLQHQQARQVLQ